MKTYTRFSILILFVCCCFSAKAQISVSLTVSSPPTPTACKDNLYTVVVDSIATSMGFGISGTLTSTGSTKTNCDSVNLFPNVYFVLDTVITGNLTSIITDTTPSPGVIWRGILTPSASQCTVKYHVYIDCAGLSISGTTSNLILNQNFIDTSTALIYDIVGVGSSLYSQSVGTPYITNKTDTIYVNYLDTTFLEFNYRNTGAFDANISFRFYPDTIGCIPSSLPLSFTDSIGGTFCSGRQN